MAARTRPNTTGTATAIFRKQASSETRGKESGGSEFDRFDQLTRKLVNVPKTELDERRKGGS
jgi:hypothetical protein